MKAKIEDLEFECTAEEMFELLRLRCEYIEKTSSDIPEKTQKSHNNEDSKSRMD